MSRQNERLPGEAGALEPVEQLLAAFTTAAPRIDRDRLMFAAGQASAGQASTGKTAVRPPAARPTIWHASTSALAAATLALAFSLWSRPVPQQPVARHDAPTVLPVAIAPARPAGEQVKTTGEQDNTPPPTPFREPHFAVVAPNNYVRTREIALRMGLDAIGSPGGSGGPSSEAISLGQWLSDFNRNLRTSETSGSLEPTSAM